MDEKKPNLFHRIIEKIQEWKSDFKYFLFKIEMKINPKIFDDEKRRKRIAKRLKYVSYGR